MVGAFPQEKILKKVKKPLDKHLGICYNKDTKKEEQKVESQGNQKSSKKNKKSLDKRKPRCYNKDVKKTNTKKERGSYYDE